MATQYKGWTITKLNPEVGSYNHEQGFKYTISDGYNSEYVFSLGAAYSLIDMYTENPAHYEYEALHCSDWDE